MSGSTGFGGSQGGVDAAIPLAAGRIGQQQGGGLANNPLAFVDAMTKIQQFRQQQQLFPGELELQRQGITGGATKLGQQQAAAAANYLRSLIGQENVSHDDVVRALGAAHGVAGVNTDNLVQQLATYQPGPGGNYRGFVNQVVLPTMSESGAIGAVTPQPQNVATGGEVRTGVTAPLMAGSAAPGTFRQTGSLGVSMTPDQLGQKVEWEDASGVKQQGTMAEWLRLHDQGAAIGQPSPVGGGSNPLLGPFAPGTNGQPDLAGRTGPIPGPRPGFKTSAEASAKQNTDQAMALQASTNNLPAQKATLGNLEGLLSNFTSGGPADWMQSSATFLNRINPFGNAFDPSRIQSEDEFRKQAFVLAQQQFNALHGTGTDAQLSSATHTSPSAMLSNQSNIGILHLLKGNVDAQQVMANEWQKWLGTHDGDTSTYGKFVTDFNKSFDPRVFQAVYATDQKERDQIKKGMSTTELVKFRSDFNAAVEKGWIPDPRG